MDHGLFLEKLWLVIFNYRKYNKNYKHLKVKDYEVKNYELIPIKNSVTFSYFNIYCQLYMTLLIDNVSYNIFISPREIYIKKSNDYNILYFVDSKIIKSYKERLQNNTNYNVLINLNNNILKVSINNDIIIDYNFNNVKHIIFKNATIYDMGKYNKFKNK
jgi:hypothetical protein